LPIVLMQYCCLGSVIAYMFESFGPTTLTLRLTSLCKDLSIRM